MIVDVSEGFTLLKYPQQCYGTGKCYVSRICVVGVKCSLLLPDTGLNACQCSGQGHSLFMVNFQKGISGLALYKHSLYKFHSMSIRYMSQSFYMTDVILGL